MSTGNRIALHPLQVLFVRACQISHDSHSAPYPPEKEMYSCQKVPFVLHHVAHAKREEVVQQLLTGVLLYIHY